LLVLADEPTGNLDEDTGAKVMELLVNLTRESGKNLIMATHNLDNARLADRVFHLHEGKLIEDIPAPL
jgi:putative ABC transport system ATP-binding protein